MLSVRWICSLYISLEDEISFDRSTCGVGNVFISPYVSIARQRQDIVENVEGWHSTCHNVFFLQIFCFDALKSFLCLLNGWDIPWKDDLNHIICDYLNRELRSIDKIVHWQAISVGIFGVQNSLELPWRALLKSCLFLYMFVFRIFSYVSFQIGLIILFRSREHMALIIQSYKVLFFTSSFICYPNLAPQT